MLNYLNGEFYKVFRRKYFFITLAILLAGIAFLVWGWTLINRNGSSVNFYFGSSMLVLMFSAGLYCTLITSDMVFSDQYKSNTLKNEVSFGLSRTRIYVGKLLVQTIIAVLLCAVAVLAYMGLCWLGLYHDGMDAAGFQLVGYCLLGVFPLWLGAQAFSNAILFNVKNEIMGAGIVVAAFMLLHNVIRLLAMFFTDKLMVLYSLMPTVMVETLPNMVGDWSYIAQCWAVGLVWVALSSVLGLQAFRRKEIN